ncbi:hypothetical protein BGX38DRAFT_684461 [Terfezia claveryi]|nr:hypothetical protein BGX38DRAFT_684461 [Terfezia claveryi]
MDAPELPGLYYDPERKKYFRILPNHLAPSNSSFYTRNTVASLKAAAQSKAHAALATSIATSRAHRHQRFNPFLRTTLFRELGTAGTPAQVCEAVRETYARSLRRRKSLLPRKGAEKGFGCFDVMQGVRGATEEVRGWGGFVESGSSLMGLPTAEPSDGEGGKMESLILAVGGANGKVAFSKYFVDKYRGELLISGEGEAAVNMVEDTITSVTFSAEGKICATSLGGWNQPCAALFHLPSHPANPIPATSHLYHYIFPPARSIWCSTTNVPPPTSLPSTSHSFSSAATFALGTSAGITLIKPVHFGYINTSYPVPSDVFALAYLPTHSTESTILSGSRDGGIRIHPSTTSHPNTTPIINHGSLLTHLHPHPTMPHLLLAKGPQKTALYDLRFPHSASPSMSFRDQTRAVLTYEDLLDPSGFRIDEGWGVSSDGELMAGAVKTIGEPEVGLWSVLTGKRWSEVFVCVHTVSCGLICCASIHPSAAFNL